MRILIKGGVWKNTEDEILKSAVMKYGKCQWARVASLLTRKSAKQCKARWYEWLDPSIKKTEWNRDEEEKLLHLAKLLPNQWRTIAPIVGRTAGQCIEHYEKLLDQAQETQQAGDEAEDPRRLRPGEIDPFPETKPARPDPIDMDEDEKEMLSEARARLANTKGKKAKRKARERQLEESRRLSMLQKRRELKAAGVESKLVGLKKRKYIDYAREIPFQQAVPAGFYDVGDERVKSTNVHVDAKVLGIELAKMEGKHQKDDEDKEKQKDKKRLKTLFKSNAPLAILNISEQNDPTTLRRRSMLSLPEPQVTERELEEIVKQGQNMMLPPEGGLGGRSTQALIGDYTQSFQQKQTPLRTPVQENIIMQEARNQRAFRDMDPLAGDDLPELYEGTGFQGMTPRESKMATPNTVLATPGHNGGSTPMATPGSVSGVMVAGTPMRDQFGLNDMNSDSFTDTTSVSSRFDKERERQSRAQLAAQLQGLPEPEYTYEIAIPKGGDEMEVEGAMVIEDAAEVAEARREERERLESEELERRSTVLKRNLPRPSDISAEASRIISQSSLDSKATPELELASSMINKEMVRIIKHDDYKFPSKSKDKKRSSARPTAVQLDIIDDQDMEAARELITREAEASIVIEVQALDGEEGEDKIESRYKQLAHEYALIWEENQKNKMFLPSRGERGSYGVSENKMELLTALATQFAALKARIDKDSKSAQKLESHLQVTTQGYSIRGKKLQESVLTAFENMSNLQREYVCFSKMLEAERRAAGQRLSVGVTEMNTAEANEALAQERYARFMQKVQVVQMAK
mmetsp:Transcript_1666/g.1816  ORF Transcript_1666/g.1816 Transcript_1666/m.1816 type:complete len:805 (+) Transcript_1666:172-2586(+)|eukprot:CAMPEP_0119036176 /NCGR_PEP_ID=MMETSP1177-20130426/3710_1 /TAXON_ID=2985 /ORGANISM="Ochromonas sp, Strain CCMP1899" /LENGTH=804 /DNA_ID=CAMNT_0006995609 /DNA_START=169 /DNA_END=2583 /DNA_ORIENTATION=-